ncbi:MAG: site-specific integrase [Blastochloris viridis]|uniref:Site-specific integrase n=1 Tax=Blastochloris viridis TaxID=1079 RepID=A0A6N4RCL2_BLAVI|nr:MAG: site-specific integrase [Blastochloris viridis]
MAHTYLLNRRGVYYFRMVLPTHLQRYCGQREWFYSLDTKNYREARRRCTTLARLALELTMKIDHLIQKQPTLAPDQVKAIIRSYFTEALTRLKLHVNNVREAKGHLDHFANGDPAKQEVVDNLIKEPLFYLPDSMEGIISRDSNGNRAQMAFKALKVPIGMKPVEMRDIMDYVLRQNNLELRPNANAYKQLEQGIQQAISTLQDMQAQYAEDVIQPEIKDHLFKDLADAEPSKLMQEVIDAHVKDISKGVEPLTLQRKNTAFKWFVEKYGDIPIQTVSKKHHANGFKDLLTRIPAHASKRHAGKTLTQLEAETGDKLAFNSQRIYLSAMHALFDWAERAGYYEGDNPFSRVAPPKQKVKLADAKGPYSAETLKAIFASPIFTGHGGQRTKAGNRLIKDSLYWVPLIGLLTGARREELCQLHTKDIHKVDGVWVFDINDKDGKHLKNPHSKRMVPIHQRLIDLGFLDYHQQQQAKRSKLLFPDITYSAGKERHGDNFGRRYNRALATLKLKGERRDFHSFRHTMIDALRVAGIQEGVMMAITGHKDERMVGNYGKGYTLPILQQALNQVDFPSINWATVGFISPATKASKS